MTSIGRFALRSETLSNPSVPTLFIALSGDSKNMINSTSQETPTLAGMNTTANGLAGKAGMTVPEFSQTFISRDVHRLHPRYLSRVSKSDDRYFESIVESSDDDIAPLSQVMKNHVYETLHTSVYRKDLARRIEQLLMTPMEVQKKLWEVQISTGPLGSSGAIGQNLLPDLLSSGKDIESILLFRFHHALGDAASFAAACSDLFDETLQIKSMIKNELQKRKYRKKKRGILMRLFAFIQRLMWLLFGTMHGLAYHGYLLLTTRTNPFLQIIPQSAKKEQGIGRSVSWGNIAPIAEVKRVARIIGGDRRVTINDVFVSCVSAAVARQLAEHRERYASDDSDKHDGLYNNFNVVIPVHLTGGIILPGREIGNLLGAFVAKVPGEDCQQQTFPLSASERLIRVHESLDKMKRSPMPFLSHFLAGIVSRWLPKTWASEILQKSSANSSFVVTNARGFTKKVHINGRTVESMAGFIPLPPGIPIGVVVQSYGSDITISVSGERYCIPDADKFMQWILDEYKLLCEEASMKETMLSTKSL